jgi:hypothetical protein
MAWLTIGVHIPPNGAGSTPALATHARLNTRLSASARQPYRNSYRDVAARASIVMATKIELTKANEILMSTNIDLTNRLQRQRDTLEQVLDACAEQSATIVRLKRELMKYEMASIRPVTKELLARTDEYDKNTHH